MSEKLNVSAEGRGNTIAGFEQIPILEYVVHKFDLINDRISFSQMQAMSLNKPAL